MAKSTLHANTILAAIADMDLHAETHISLHTGDPGTTGASEASAGNYARVEVNARSGSSPAWDNPDSLALTHVGAITFPQGGGDAAVTHFGLYDASSSGNFIRGGELDSGFTYASNVTPEFEEGALELTEA